MNERERKGNESEREGTRGNEKERKGNERERKRNGGVTRGNYRALFPKETFRLPVLYLFLRYFIPVEGKLMKVFLFF